MALFRGIQEYIALDANNITLVFDSGNIVNISGNNIQYILVSPSRPSNIISKSLWYTSIYEMLPQSTTEKCWKELKIITL